MSNSVGPTIAVNSLITWPKNRLQTHQTIRDLKENLQTDAALHLAKKFLTDSAEDDPMKTKKIIQQLCDAIDRAKEKIRSESMNNLKEEPQFSSMVDVSHHQNLPLSDLVSIPEGKSMKSFQSSVQGG